MSTKQSNQTHPTSPRIFHKVVGRFIGLPDRLTVAVTEDEKPAIGDIVLVTYDHDNWTELYTLGVRNTVTLHSPSGKLEDASTVQFGVGDDLDLQNASKIYKVKYISPDGWLMKRYDVKEKSTGRMYGPYEARSIMDAFDAYVRDMSGDYEYHEDVLEKERDQYRREDFEITACH